MPIKGLSELRRFSRGGKIRLGEKRKTAGGKEYPSKTDHFVFDPDDESLIPKFDQLFGAKPKKLLIAFASEDIERVFPQYYKCYSARGLLCKGDGEIATRRADESSDMFDVDCPTPGDCDFAIARKDSTGKPGCRRVASLQFFIPDLPVMQVFQIDTTSFNSIVNINSQIEVLRRVCGRISFIPVTLALKEQETMLPTGKKGSIFALDLIVGVGLRDLPSIKALTAEQFPQLEAPPVSERLPDDLYSPKNLEDPEHRDPTPAPTNGTQQPDDMDEKKDLFTKCEKIESELGLNGFTKESMKSDGYTSLAKCPASALTAVHGELTSRYVAAQKTVEADAPFDMDAPVTAQPASEQRGDEPETTYESVADDAPEW